MRKNPLCPAIVFASFIGIPAGTAAADDLFVISGTSNGTPITPVGASNLIDLVNSAVNNQGQFTSLANTTAALSLNYGGIANAISVDKNPTNTFGTLTFVNKDGSRTTRTFDTTAPSANGCTLQQLIEDYLKKDGSSDLKSFFQAVNAQSVIAVSDGNPNSTTARMADQTFDRFGRFNRQTAMTIQVEQHEEISADNELLEHPGFQLRVGGSAYSYKAGDFSGQSATLDSSFNWTFTTRVGLTLGTFIAYNTIEDADVYHLGLCLGVPIRPVLATPTQPWTWQITPSFSVAGSASEDAAAGGVIYGAAFTSLLRWQISNRFSLEMSNQAGFYDGRKLTFSSFEIDPGVSQQILKNGLEAQLTLGERGWYLYGGASYTNFLADAAVSNYVTPSAGIGWHKPDNHGTSFELGFLGDFGDNFTAYGARLSANFAF
jgi:hypothetical protein